MSEMKQVIVIRIDLDLSGGKAVAQGGHAVMGAYFDSRDRWGPIAGDMLEAWNESKKKVCLAIDSEEELLALAQACEKKNMGHYLVRDAGRTELEPGTVTALGIGPDFSRHIDEITGHLSLF
jgi:PTH2 family peptidyl-tRNA hydrolase